VQKAIIQSGSCPVAWPTGGFYPGAPAQTPYTSLTRSERNGTAIAATLGCSARDLACLRRQSVAKLLPLTPIDGLMAWGTPLVPHNPADALRDGQFVHIPVLIGSNHDEMRFIIGGAIVKDPITAARYPTLVRTSYPTSAAAVLAQYPLSRYPNGAQAWTTVAQDGMWACPTLTGNPQLAAHTTVYGYEFDDPDAPNPPG